MKRHCLSCGEQFDVYRLSARLSARGIVATEADLFRCEECADELFRGVVKIAAQVVAARPGRRRRGLFLAGQRDNAVRILEGG